MALNPAATGACKHAMIEDGSAIETISEVIRTAVAPVFLLMALSSLLATLSGRLSRIIDRKRALENRFRPQEDGEVLQELRRLRRRIRLVNWSIRLFVSSALAVCFVVVALFIGEFVTAGLATLIAVLFVIAMLLIICGLLTFLAETRVASLQAREGMEVRLGEREPSAD